MHNPQIWLDSKETKTLISSLLGICLFSDNYLLQITCGLKKQKTNIILYIPTLSGDDWRKNKGELMLLCITMQTITSTLGEGIRTYYTTSRIQVFLILYLSHMFYYMFYEKYLLLRSKCKCSILQLRKQ